MTNSQKQNARFTLRMTFRNGAYLFLSILLISMNSCFGPCVEGVGPIVSENFDLENFESVNCSGSFKVKIHHASSQSVKLTGHQNIVETIELKVSRGQLGFRLPERCYKNYELLVEIGMDVLEELDVSGSGDVELSGFTNLEDLDIEVSGSGNLKSTSVIKVSDDFRLDVTGSSDVTMRLEADNVELSNTGSGDIELTGKANELESSTTGSGNLHLLDFEVMELGLVSTGSGDSYVWATEKMSVNISGSGDVHYRGRPEIEAKMTGSGKMRETD